jgi:hypothetical protein
MWILRKHPSLFNVLSSGELKAAAGTLLNQRDFTLSPFNSASRVDGAGVD